MFDNASQSFVVFGAALALFSGLTLMVDLDSAHANMRGWDEGGSSAQPTVADLIPTMSSDEAYSERYGFAVNLDGGGHIGVDWTISNLGWGDGHGATEVRVELPGKDKYKYKDKVSRKKWRYSKDAFDLDVANTRVRALDKDSFQIIHKGDGVRFNLRFDNTTEMWKPGSGRIDVKDGYYKFNLLAPRANVTGEVTIDGETKTVKSTRQGYADHVATNVAPFDLGKRFSRFRNYNDDVFVMWREIEMHDDHGGESLTWITVGYKDKIVFSDPDADIKFGRHRKDPKSGYSFPLDVQIDGASGGDSIKMVLRGKRFERKDLLESYGAAAKVVASAVSKPYRYTIPCKYELQMNIGGDTAKISGDSHFVLDYLND